MVLDAGPGGRVWTFVYWQGGHLVYSGGLSVLWMAVFYWFDLRAGKLELRGWAVMASDEGFQTHPQKIPPWTAHLDVPDGCRLSTYH